jgi:hypothetical protein
MLVVVPGKGSDAVAGLHSQPIQDVPQALHPLVQMRVGVVE